ncbi:MAG: GIY-YIG nuclease family protein [Chlorobi bacterium]|nr:GIY-YIG nuclease family protein [Chlorobiota bacterium]
MKKFYVYILQSEKTGRYYCGQTHKLEDRLMRHNSGRSKFTSSERPWKLIRTFIFASRSEAMLLEKKIKKRGIQRYLKDMMDS